MYELLKKRRYGKRGRFQYGTRNDRDAGFMNVGTAAAIKGAVSTDDLRQIKRRLNCQIHITFMSDRGMKS